MLIASLEIVIFSEHVVCRISSQGIFLYKIICVKEIFEKIFCLKETFNLGSIHKGCSYVRGGGGSKNNTNADRERGRSTKSGRPLRKKNVIPYFLNNTRTDNLPGVSWCH